MGFNSAFKGLNLFWYISINKIPSVVSEDYRQAQSCQLLLSG